MNAPLQRLRCALAAVCLALLAPASAWAQVGWEYTPYAVRVWIAARPQPQLPAAVQQQVVSEVAARAEVVFGAVWSVQVEMAPLSVRDALAAGQELPLARLAAVAPDATNGDKLIAVRLMRGLSGWEIEAKELDLRTQQWGTPTRSSAGSIDALGLATWDAVASAFTPLVRIESVDEKQVVARLRAGGLIVDAASPALAEPGMVLRPIVRRNDRSGQPAAKGGIQAIPWTLLSIESREDALLTCRVYSGYRSAIPSRGGIRTERLGLLVKPQFAATSLKLLSRGAEPRPLSGYDVYARGADGEEAELVGTTDWRGQIEIPRSDGSLRVFLVKNGSQLLARLPMVPGQEPALVAPLLDDDSRLQAEGAVAALYSRALDLAARREILAARFRARLKEGKFDEAQQLLDSFRQLESRADLGRSLDEQQKLVDAQDTLTQRRIDKLFGEARKVLLVRALGDEMVNTLAAELAKARNPAKTAAAGS
ncbi:MAG: hypothetical protein WD872_10470 [Pirellulaceae bacterium]